MHALLLIAAASCPSRDSGENVGERRMTMSTCDPEDPS